MKIRKLNITAIIVCSLASFFYLYDFLLRVMPSAMTNDLMSHFHIGAARLGVMLAIFYYAYAPMQLPAGLLFDRVGTRLLLTIMVLVCAVGTLLFGITDNIMIATIGRFLIGFSSAFAFLGALVLAARWLPHKYFALFVGLVQLLGCAGAIVGEAPIAVAVEHFGWQKTNFAAALIGFVLAILFWVLLRDHPEGAVIENKKSANVLKQLSAVLKNLQNWWVGLYAFAIWAPASIFAVLWGVPFLMTFYQISASAASFAVSLVWVGIGIGCPLVGWWSDHVGKRCLPLYVTSFLGVITSCLILYLNNTSIYLMDVWLFLLGVSISGMVITFGLIKDINASSVTGTANGFNNMAVLIGGIIFQPMVGFILHALWNGKLVNNIPVYSLSNYKIALSIVPLCFVIALLAGVFFIKETHCIKSR
ncbi:MAG: MFS transporter [Gammaproteobacteria bacterium]|jgi:MFS family permease